MRNLKRALSLAVATVMTLGLMVVGTGAVGYDDVTSEDNVEAIEVLQAVGIMTGDENGNFDPDGMVTRNQMAVIMSQLLNLNYDYYRGTNPFTDVPSWAAPYVAACAAEGVVAGIGDGLYGGENQVTAAQAALMILKALGYFQYEADFDGDWQVATIRQASYIRLFDGIDASAEEALTRNQIAQLVLNGLKSSMVTFTGDVGITVNDVVIGHHSEYTARTSADAQYDAIVGGTTDIAPQGQYIIQLGEELYDGDLRLDYTTDDFGRPSRVWEYDGDEIGTYVRDELLRQEYTVKVTGKDLYDLLGTNTVNTYNFYVAVDGVDDYTIDDDVFDEDAINRSNGSAVGGTGNGVLTQVFVDTSDKWVYITVINTYLAIADDDYDDRQNEVSLTVYDLEKNGSQYIKSETDNQSVGMDVLGEDFAIEDVLKDDLFLVTVANGEVQTMAEPETLSAVEISSFSTGKNVTVDGTKYEYASTAEYEYDTLDEWTGVNSTTNLKDRTYNVYLDQYGYVIGAEEVEAPDNYLFITGINGNYDNLANVTYEANAIFLDGTMEKITINSKKGDIAAVVNGDERDATINSWFTYTVNSSDVYTVELVERNAGANKMGQSAVYEFGTAGTANTLSIDYKNDSAYSAVSAAGAGTGYRVYGNDDTVYLTASIEEITTAGSPSKRTDVVIDDVDSVAVGIDNVNITAWDVDKVEDEVGTVTGSGKYSSGMYTLYDKDGYIIAMVVVGEDTGSSDSLVYIHSGSVSEESYNKSTEEWTWTRTAIIDGEEVTLVEVDDTGISMLNKMDEDQWYRVRFNADGEVVSVRADGVSTSIDFDDDFDSPNWGMTSTSTPYAYINDHDGTTTINDAINTAGVDIVLYHEDFGGVYPSAEGKTLYMTQSHESYIRFTDDVKVVFEQQDDNVWDTYFWTGENGVDRALNELRKVSANSNLYDYEISAVIDNGRATSIIIKDLTGDGYVAGDRDDDARVITNTGARVGYVGTEIYGGGETLTPYEMMLILADQIEADGYDVTNVDSTGVDYIGPNGYPTSVASGTVKQVYKVTFEQEWTSNWADATIEVKDAYVNGSTDTVTFTLTYKGTPVASDVATRNFAIDYTTGGKTTSSNLSASGMTNNVITLTDTPNITSDIHYVFTANPTTPTP